MPDLLAMSDWHWRGELQGIQNQILSLHRLLPAFLVSLSSTMSIPSYCDPRNPAHSIGTSRNFTSGCRVSHTAIISSPTISGPHALSTKRAEIGRSFPSRIDCAGKEVLAAIHDLVHAELGTEDHCLHIVALLRSKCILDEILTSLRRMSKECRTRDFKCGQGGTVESTPKVWVCARLRGRR